MNLMIYANKKFHYKTFISFSLYFNAFMHLQVFLFIFSIWQAVAGPLLRALQQRLASSLTTWRPF